MQPVNSLDPISGQTHPQEDVFFQKVKAQWLIGVNGRDASIRGYYRRK